MTETVNLSERDRHDRDRAAVELIDMTHDLADASLRELTDDRLRQIAQMGRYVANAAEQALGA